MVTDITHLLDRETGTAFTPETLLFSDFEDGGVFDYGEWKARDMDEMFARDGKARTLEQALSLPLRRAKHELKQDGATDEVMQFVHHVLYDRANSGGMSTPLNLVLAQMTGAAVYRKAFFEKVYTERDGRVVLDKLAWRPPSTCALVRDAKTAAFRGFKQMPVRYEDTEEIKIPAQRAFVHIYNKHRNPLEGTSDFEIALWCYQTKAKIRFLWYQFLESQSLPKTIVYARSEQEARAGAKKIAGLKNGGIVGLVDGQHRHEVLESSGKGADQFMEALKWLDGEASGSVLAGFTDLPGAASTGVGSYALSKDQSDFFLMSREADAADKADDLNQYVISPLVAINYGVEAKAPRLEFDSLSEYDAEASLQMLQSLASSQHNLPREFMDELIERSAGFLEMDVDKVRAGIERAAQEAEETARAAASQQQPAQVDRAGQVASVAGAVGVVDRAVRRRAQRDGGGNGAADAGPATA